MNRLITHTTIGNVFEALGFSAGESTLLVIKTDLLIELERLLKRRRLSMARAAKILGVKAAVVSQLKRGDLNAFTVDALIQMLEHAGMNVRLSVTDKKRTSAA